MTRARRGNRTTAQAARPDCPALPPHEMLPSGPILKVDRWDVEFAKINEIAGLLFLPQGLDKTEKDARIVRALELYDSLAPVDAAEGLLAEQMVGTHFAAHECLRRAALPEQTFAGRDMALKHATRLMKLYAEQLAALDKHRGKVQQKVTVEHVHVHSGGQAIVGSIERPGPPAPSGPPALDAPTEHPLEFDDASARERVPRGETA